MCQWFCLFIYCFGSNFRLEISSASVKEYDMVFTFIYTVDDFEVCAASVYNREFAFCIKDYEISLYNATLCTKMVVRFLL